MKQVALRHIPFGKKVEDNVVESLKMAGINLETGADLDHNHKIDFILNLKKKKVGVQFSLKQDEIKAKVAKICALDVVPRFIYLSMAKEFFDRPDKKNGKDLYFILNRIAGKYLDKALHVNINHCGMQVKAL